VTEKFIGNRCPVKKCAKRIDHTVVMCLEHWKMVPKKIQRAIWSAWKQRKNAAILCRAHPEDTDYDAMLIAAERKHYEAKRDAVRAVELVIEEVSRDEDRDPALRRKSVR
jgi:hypothetical protein